MECADEDRVWVWAHPLSKVSKSFAAKLAPKWQEPYRVVQQAGPVNYQVVLEDSCEDLEVVHISWMKPCYPTTQEIEKHEHRRDLEIFNEESDEEVFLGFSDTACSGPSGEWATGSVKDPEDHLPDSSSETDIDAHSFGKNTLRKALICIFQTCSGSLQRLTLGRLSLRGEECGDQVVWIRHCACDTSSFTNSIVYTHTHPIIQSRHSSQPRVVQMQPTRKLLLLPSTASHSSACQWREAPPLTLASARV